MPLLFDCPAPHPPLGADVRCVWKSLHEGCDELSGLGQLHLLGLFAGSLLEALDKCFLGRYSVPARGWAEGD